MNWCERCRKETFTGEGLAKYMRSRARRKLPAIDKYKCPQGNGWHVCSAKSERTGRWAK